MYLDKNVTLNPFLCRGPLLQFTGNRVLSVITSWQPPSWGFAICSLWSARSKSPLLPFILRPSHEGAFSLLSIYFINLFPPQLGSQGNVRECPHGGIQGMEPRALFIVLIAADLTLSSLGQRPLWAAPTDFITVTDSCFGCREK